MKEKAARVESLDRFYQRFNAELIARYKYDLQQSQQSLEQAQEHGDRQGIIKASNDIAWLQDAIDFHGPAVIDGTVSPARYLALPERIER